MENGTALRDARRGQHLASMISRPLRLRAPIYLRYVQLNAAHARRGEEHRYQQRRAEDGMTSGTTSA